MDVDWLDARSLREILRLARDGLPTAVLRRPRRPGRGQDPAFEEDLDALLALPAVVRRIGDLPVEPLLEGADLPWYWARETDGGVQLFVAHPAARRIRYPMPPGMADASGPAERRVRAHVDGVVHDVVLRFRAGRSLLVRVHRGGVGVEDAGPLGREGEVAARDGA